MLAGAPAWSLALAGAAVDAQTLPVENELAVASVTVEEGKDAIRESLDSPRR